MLIAYAILLFRYYYAGDNGDDVSENRFFELAAWCAIFGLFLFPSGLAEIVADISLRNAAFIALAGYGAYIVLAVVAVKRSSWKVFLVLCLLLLLNIVGCQLDHIEFPSF